MDQFQLLAHFSDRSRPFACEGDASVLFSLRSNDEEIGILCNKHAALSPCEIQLLIIRGAYQTSLFGRSHVNPASPQS